MSVIKINAITVPADSGDALAERFAARQGSLDGQKGYQGFELLKPTDGRNVWLVITRWDSDEDFEAWRSSQEFKQSHSQNKDAEGQQRKPGGTGAELWEYTVAVTG